MASGFSLRRPNVSRRLEVAESELAGIEEALSKEKDARVARWLLGVRLVCLKRTPENAGVELGVSGREIRRWVNRFNDGGLEALRPNWNTGHMPKLAPERMEEFRQRILDGPTKEDVFSAWRGHFIRDVLRDEFDAPYELTGTYKLLHRMGLSLLMPRPKHPGSSTGEQEEFKKKRCRRPGRQSAPRRRRSGLTSGSRTKRASGSRER
jgi:transposase